MLGITFRQFEVFVEVVDLGSFRACADRLGVTQVSVSGHIRAMERMIGQPLFQRRSGAASDLTAEGQRVYHHAVLLLRQAQLLIDDMAAARATKHRRRLIVAGPGYVGFRLTHVFAEFTLRHAEWQVVHEPNDHASAAKLIASGQADLVFALAPADRIPAGGEILWQEELGLYIGKEHPLAGQESVSAIDLARFPLIHLPKSDPLRSVIDGVLDAAGVTGSPVALHTANAMLARRTVMQSDTVGCLFSHLVRRDVERGLLVKLPLEQALPSLQVAVLTSPRALIQRAAASLIALVRDEVARNSLLLPPRPSEDPGRTFAAG